LTNLILVEKKTKLDHRLKRLELNEPSNNSESRKIDIYNKKGQLVASGFIGKRKYFLYVDGRSGTYIRTGNDLQSWLAEGEMNFGFYSQDWLNKSIFDFNPKNVKKIIIEYPNRSLITGLRINTLSKMEFIDTKKDREFKTDNEADRLAYVVEKFDFFDVESRSDNNFLNKSHIKSIATYEFFDGFIIKFHIYTITDEKKKSNFQEPTRWARVNIEGINISLEQQYKKEKLLILNDYLGKWDFRLQELDGIRLTKNVESMLKPLEK